MSPQNEDPTQDGREKTEGGGREVSNSPAPRNRRTPLRYPASKEPGPGAASASPPSFVPSRRRNALHCNRFALHCIAIALHCNRIALHLQSHCVAIALHCNRIALKSHCSAIALQSHCIAIALHCNRIALQSHCIALQRGLPGAPRSPLRLPPTNQPTNQPTPETDFWTRDPPSQHANQTTN